MNFSQEIMQRIQEVNEIQSKFETFPIDKMELLIQNCLNTFDLGGKIAFVGNGGSAAEAIHLAAEFTGRCVIDHEPLPAICLNESQSSLTAIVNDYGPEHMYSRMVRAQLKKDDILIAMSTSGKSKNILNAISAALEIGVNVYLWTGDVQLDYPDVEIWKVPSLVTPRVQEIHLMWGHILAEIIEKNYFSSKNK